MQSLLPSQYDTSSSTAALHKDIESVGVFDCFDSATTSCAALCCGCLVEGQLYGKIGKSACVGCLVGCCVPGIGHAILRTEYRKHMGLQSDLTDLIIGCMLPCCSQVQLFQQLEKFEAHNAAKMQAPSQQIIYANPATTAAANAPVQQEQPQANVYYQPATNTAPAYPQQQTYVYPQQPQQ